MDSRFQSYFSVAFILAFLPGFVYSQNPPLESSIEIMRADSEIILDGLLDEQAWQDADMATGFYMVQPVDTMLASSQTEVKMTFDDQNLYFGIISYTEENGPPIVESLRRDFDFRGTENVGIYFDPFDDKTNGFNFNISPYGVQREGLVSERVRVSSEWDNKWYSQVTRHDDHWIAELAIPFKTLRYNQENLNWNIQFLRNDVKNNEISGWTAVPRQFRPNNFLYSGRMVWKDPPPPPGSNVSIIPYMSGLASKDHEEGTSTTSDANMGFDAKIGVTPSLNLDLTVNPDFSQVEVDQQVTNLDRFEIFFPERRQFFLENSDLFSESGFRRSRPFFSRRIGIARDTSGSAVQIPIIYGARLSGKIGRDWRVGLLNMQTRSQSTAELSGAENPYEGYQLPGQNYTVAVFQRQILANSNVGGIFVNRQAVDYNENDSTVSVSEFNRVVGVDLNYANARNTLGSDVFYHRSFDPEKKDKNYAAGGFLRFQTRNYEMFLFTQHIGEDYNAEVGFVPRKGVRQFTNRHEYNFFPKRSSVVQHGPQFRISYTTDSDFNISDRSVSLEYNVQFQNTSRFQVELQHSYVLLTDDFDPTRSDGIELLEGTDYDWRTVSVEYGSDGRKSFLYEVGTEIGSYYNGTRYVFGGGFGYFFRPFGSVIVTGEYNNIRLPAPYNDADFFLIGPRFDFTFTNNLFFTTFVQYNNQADNININSRLQWRFKPVSDLFIVYTDNHFPDGLRTKNRALAVKLTYWFNL